MKFGDMEVFLIEDGMFRLDGGAMFGVVPKVLWSRTNAPDDRNRILLAANNLLIKTGDAVVLIDNGLGGKWRDREKEMFAVAEPRNLITDLARCDVMKEDVTHMVCSHLHFDHVGGGTFIDKDGGIKVQFPNAKHIIQRGEWEVAHHPNPRDRASYLPENLHPLEEAGVVELVDGDTEIVPGVTMLVTGGHTKHHTIIRVESGGHTLVFLADLIPTASHIQVPYVMGYDLYPQQTMEYKAKLLDEAFQGNWLLFFEHGPAVKAGHLSRDERGRWKLEKFDLDSTDYEEELAAKQEQDA